MNLNMVRMHCLVKEQKKSTFTVPFLGPSGGTKNETAKSQNQQQRPTRATNKKWQLRSVKQQAHRVGTEEARTCEAWFQLTFRPQKWNLKAHMWHQLASGYCVAIVAPVSPTPWPSYPYASGPALLASGCLWWPARPTNATSLTAVYNPALRSCMRWFFGNIHQSVATPATPLLRGMS